MSNFSFTLRRATTAVALASLALCCVARAQDASPAPAGRLTFRNSVPDISNSIQTLDTPGTSRPVPVESPTPAPQPRLQPQAQEQSGADNVDSTPAAPRAMAIPGTTGVEPVTATPASNEAQAEVESLNDQRDTLQSELHYARSKLDAARKRADTAPNAEVADKWQQEVRDWDARVRTLDGQFSALNNEVQGTSEAIHPQSAAEPEQSLILPGDNLEIFVVEDPSFNGRYQVRRGGYIILPAVGRIPLAGKSIQGAETEVRKALESTQLQHASVMVEKVEGADVASGPVVFLCGAFRNAHPFRIPPGTKPTVVNVLLSCGGVTPDADTTRVKVMRIVANKSVVEEVNVARMMEGGGLTSDLTLDDGDVLLVPYGPSNNVFVTGRVNHPGAQALHPGLTAFSAILNAGGFGRFADLRKVYVLRAAADGTKVRIPVNVLGITKGHVPDLPLQGNDILIVPERFFSF